MIVSTCPPEPIAPTARLDLFRPCTNLVWIVTALAAVDVGAQRVAAQEIAVPATPIEAEAALPLQSPLRGFKPLASIAARLTPPSGPVPADATAELFPRTPRAFPAGHERGWEGVEFAWEPAVLAYHPLYFEDYELERFGKSRRPRVQPWASGAHFFGSALTLPLRAVWTRPGACIVDVDPCRPRARTSSTR